MLPAQHSMLTISEVVSSSVSHCNPQCWCCQKHSAGHTATEVTQRDHQLSPAVWQPCKNAAQASNYHIHTLRHVCRLMTDNVAQMDTYSIIVSRLNVRSSEVQATFDKLQRIQNNLTRVVCPGGGCNDDGPLLRTPTGFQWGSRSCTKWLWQPTWCGAQQYQQTLAMTRSLWSSNAKLMVISPTNIDLDQHAFSVTALSIWNYLLSTDIRLCLPFLHSNDI